MTNALKITSALLHAVETRGPLTPDEIMDRILPIVNPLLERLIQLEKDCKKYQKICPPVTL